jgi:hypothetical protein
MGRDALAGSAMTMTMVSTTVLMLAPVQRQEKPSMERAAPNHRRTTILTG